jgi:hypothetical protein
MRPKHSHTGYGVWNITRQIARRIQQEREAVESPPLLPWLLSPVQVYAPPLDRMPHKTEKRPLAA